MRHTTQRAGNGRPDSYFIFFPFTAVAGFLLLMMGLSGCGGSGRSTPPVADEFTIVALPDTQNYSRYSPEIFRAQTQWIADHVQDQNIKLVLGHYLIPFCF